MSDSIHTQVYQRFFAVLTSVIPGLNLIIGFSALLLFILSDIAEMEWGWGVGLSAILFSILFVIWVVIGVGIQKWAEEKSTGMLAGICAPFLVVDAIVFIYLFLDVVVGFGGEEEEAARLVFHALSSLV